MRACFIHRLIFALRFHSISSCNRSDSSEHEEWCRAIQHGSVESVKQLPQEWRQRISTVLLLSEGSGSAKEAASAS